MTEKQFADGIRFNTPSQKAPEFVKGTISIQIEKFIPWAQAHADERGWINLDVKESKGGKIYCEVSSWKPSARPLGAGPDTVEGYAPTKAETNSDDIPF